MPFVFSFSNTITSWSTASRVLTFSAQSLRRSVTRAVIRAIARRVFFRFAEPFCWRAIRCCNAR